MKWVKTILKSNSSCHNLKKLRNKDIYQSRTDYKAGWEALGPQRTTARAIIHKWGKLGTAVNHIWSNQPTKISPRAHQRLIQEVTKEPRKTTKELQASLYSVKVNFVHDSTSESLGRNRIHGRVPWWKPLLTKKNTKARLSFARRYLDDLWFLKNK